MSALPPLCSRRQFQLYLLAGLGLAHSRSATATEAPRNGSPKILVQANNAFALALLRDVEAQAAGDNQFLSPFSIESALCIALEGARGETALEMGQVLQFPAQAQGTDEQPWDLSSIRSDFQALDKLFHSAPSQAHAVREELARLRTQLQKSNDAAVAHERKNQYQQAANASREASKLAERINQLSAQIDQFELYNANSLWLDASYPLSKHYQHTIDQFYGTADALKCDFQHQTDQETRRINRWVSEHTRDKIKDIIPEGALTTLTRLVIANAIYFKGTWAQPFDAEQTKPAPFTTSDRKKVDAVLMNRQDFEEGRYAAFNADGSAFDTPEMVSESFEEEQGYPDDNGFQVAELPYNGGSLAMMILLPRKAEGLGVLMRELTAEKLQACAERLQQRSYHVSLPKFKLESSYKLNTPLQRMGMKQAFDPGRANFSGLTESREPEHELYISLVLHKAFVDVNEQGTEAAAATIVALEPRSAPVAQRPFIPSFIADHPFVFAIRERASGLILFIGKVEKP